MIGKQKPPGRWKPGESGNPKGKPAGSGALQKLRAAIGASVPGVIAAMVQKATEGDAGAARLLLDRVLPPVKAVELAQTIDLSGDTLTDQGRAVLVAVAAGELAPGQGAALMAAIATLAGR